MSLQVKKFKFNDTDNKTFVDQGVAKQCGEPVRMCKLRLPSGAKPVMANFYGDEFCLWIHADFNTAEVHWSSHFYAFYLSGRNIPGSAMHVGSSVNDETGRACHAYDITNHVRHLETK